MRRLSLGLLVLASVATGGCVNSPSSPFAVVPGPAPTVYTGTTVDSIDGSGTLTVSLVTVQDLVSGSWEASFGGKTTKQYITGPLSGSTYTATFQSEPSTETTFSTDCVKRFDGTLTASSISGSYHDLPSRLCPSRTGTMTAKK